MTLPVKIQSCIEQYVDFHELESGDCFRAAHLQIQCFDIASTKEKSNSVFAQYFLMGKFWFVWEMNLIDKHICM